MTRPTKGRYRRQNMQQFNVYPLGGAEVG